MTSIFSASKFKVIDKLTIDKPRSDLIAMPLVLTTGSIHRLITSSKTHIVLPISGSTSGSSDDRLKFLEAGFRTVCDLCQLL
jgi:hypothetical protein